MPDKQKLYVICIIYSKKGQIRKKIVEITESHNDVVISKHCGHHLVLDHAAEQLLGRMRLTS